MLPYWVKLERAKRQVRVPDQIGALPRELRDQLRSIEPIVWPAVRFFPCQVTTRDGVVHPRVYLAEARGVGLHGFKWPWEISQPWILIEHIVSIEPSPFRLPARFSRLLSESGETRMGMTAYSITLRNGQKHRFAFSSGLLDFPHWPHGVDPEQVVAVTPHDYDPADRPNRGATFEWCLYR